MTRFIHTADWQIGKPYLQIKEEQKRYKIQQERLNAINRIREVALLEKSNFVLVAGDLFDSPTPSATSVLEVLEIIGKMNIPVLVIPGNHDHGALGTIWHRNDFLRHQKQIAPNLKLLLKRQPIEIEEAVILPCPLLRNKDTTDPTLWLRSFNWDCLPSKKPRIVLAHGGVHDFGARDYAQDDEAPLGANNLINISDLLTDQIDYIALGDWHNLKRINSKTWYPGTPEPDRFDQGQENQRGQVLNVEVIRQEIPKVKSISTGRIKWHNFNFKFNTDSDLDRFERQIEELINGRISSDLLRIEISGGLSLDGHHRYKQLIADLENKLLRLRIKGECQQAPKEGELEQLTMRAEDPLIALVASQLKQRLEKEDNKESEESLVTRKALCELFQLAVNN